MHTAQLQTVLPGFLWQIDEIDMGMTYEELSMYGRLRMIFRCGPVSMFQVFLVTHEDIFLLTFWAQNFLKTTL